MNKKIESTVRWNRTGNTADCSVASIILNAGRGCLAVIMLVLSAVVMAGDVYNVITIDELDIKYVIVTVLLLGIFIDVIFQLIESYLCMTYTFPYQLVVCAAGLGLESYLGRWFYINHGDEIRCGLYGIQSMYLPLYNWYYKENIYVSNLGNEIYIPICVMFSLSLIIGAFYCVSFVTKSKKCFILLPIGILISQMLVGKTPGWIGFALLIIGVYLTLDDIRVEKNAGKYIYKNRRKKAWYVNLYQTICVLLIMFVMAFLIKYVDEKVYDILDQGKAKVTEVQNCIEDNVYGKFLDFSYDTHSIDNATPSYKNELYFTITCDKKPKTNIYLKDYIGTNYANARWITDINSFENSCNSTDIKLSDMQTLLMESYIDSFETGNYHIEYKNWRHKLLTPYYFDTNNDEITDISKDALISKQKSKMTFNYTGSISNILTKEDIKRFSGIKNDDSEELRYRWYKRYVEENYINISQKVPSSKTLSNRINVYLWGNTPQNVNNYIYEATMEVKNLLSSYTYDRKLDKLDRNTNAVEYFLSTSKKGYCIHFATAATLILRDFGIPARYVSGYIVKQNDFAVSGNGTYKAKVLDSAAHAWVEVFYPNIGWVPLEVTPGYDSTNYDYFEETNNDDDIIIEEQKSDKKTDDIEIEKESTEPEKTSIEEKKENEPEPTKEEQTYENEVAGDTDNDKPDATQKEWVENLTDDNVSSIDLKKYMLPLVLILIIFGFIYLVFRYVKKQKENERKRFQRYMNNHQYKRLVRKINRKLYKRVKFKGRFIFATPSDDEYRVALEASFDNITSDQWDKYMDIVKEAAYSGGNVEEENAKFVITLYQKVIEYDRIIPALKLNAKIYFKK